MPSKTSSASSAGGSRSRAAATKKSTAATSPNRRSRPHGDKVSPGTSGKPAGVAPVESVTADRGLRTSVSLYESDLDALEPLRAFLRQETGVRVVPDSAMVQTLCRCVKPGPEHVAAFKLVLATTGRKYRRG